MRSSCMACCSACRVKGFPMICVHPETGLRIVVKTVVVEHEVTNARGETKLVSP